VTIELARAGHAVTALDRDPVLLAELAARAEGLPVTVVRADARDFALPARFALCIAPMQTIQLLDGPAGRLAFLACAGRHLVPGGVLAAALACEMEPFEVRDGAPGPLPDMGEFDGVLYSSIPTAVRVGGGGSLLVRRRETVAPDGRRTATIDRVRLDHVSPSELEREAVQAGLAVLGRRTIPPTPDYVGSEVVLLSG
jgi:SAM-dependent methyltransferase